MINFLILIFGLTMIYLALRSRYDSYIKAIAFQGVILFALVMLDAGEIDTFTTVFLAVEALGFKAVLIPFMLLRIVRKNNLVQETDPHIPQFSSVVIATIILLLGFYMAFWVAGTGEDIKPLYFGISISNMVVSLFIIVTRKNIITHVMGFMLLENAIFLLSLSIAVEMPLIVSMGVLLDLFLVLFILGLFVGKIQSAFDNVRSDKLTDLRD